MTDAAAMYPPMTDAQRAEHAQERAALDTADARRAERDQMRALLSETTEQRDVAREQVDEAHVFLRRARAQRDEAQAVLMRLARMMRGVVGFAHSTEAARTLGNVDAAAAADLDALFEMMGTVEAIARRGNEKINPAECADATNADRAATR